MATVITVSGGGTTLHLSPATGVPTRGGAPTAAATTPFALLVDSWTLTEAVPQAVYAGHEIIGQSYALVTESVPFIVDATSHDNLASLLRQLRQVLNSGGSQLPCVVSVQPDGATGAVAFEVLRATVQERVTEGQSPTGKGRRIEGTITWERTPLGGRLSSGETLINGVTIQNRGSGTPDNVEAFSTGAGDLIYEGSPLNLTINLQAPGTSLPGVVYLASIYSRLNSTTGSGAKTTSSTSGGTTTLADWDVSAVLTRPRLKGRVLVLAECTSNAQFRVSIYGSVLLNLVYQSDWFQAVADGPQRKGLYDLGWIDLSAIRSDPGAGTAPTLKMRLDYRSTDGASSTVTLDSTQFVLYYDWATIHPDDDNIWSGRRLICSQFPEQSGRPCLPWIPSVGLTLNTSTDLVEPIVWRGTLPRYYAGASLLLTWSGSGAYDSAGQAVVTAKHAPLYRTLRGAG